jgi:hypothetical protein
MYRRFSGRLGKLPTALSDIIGIEAARYSRSTAFVSSSSSAPVADLAPSEAHLTDYDHTHLAIYLRLLDAAKEGAAWEEAARIVLGIDPIRQPKRAKRAHDTHLARARWLSEHGYRDFLRRR